MRHQIIVLIRKILLISILFLLLFLKFPGFIIEIIAFIAVLIALFKEDIYLFFRPCKLKISVPEILDDHDEVEARNRVTGEFVEKQTYLVIIIENIGMGIAKNIEVYFNGLESNVVKNFGRYKSIPLIRSWINKPLIKFLPPHLEIRYSICYLRENNRDEMNFIFLSTPNALRKIKCTPGKTSRFKFEVVAFSDSAKPARREIEIEFMGDYLEGFKIKSS